ncbi:UDP-N-acetylmuramoyl-tripeptide--D-alanyl-D-alanine ligase [Planktothrix sp. FACHB-1355]|uniref:UDP-N-acetylmuramoyl-tripeptide--D-alanyl-D-alanine ligase n=2 Tax=Aerosakkonema funiforme TaxID=1246630 RepID=A0A926ZJF0_9CYAN|nr:UDP-N-acetylmuramoyl-tripeptide--D-alanyl-D-alanine ligase [Aerosakkonema funiforme]MBD2184599.1 UDP-N-acetylmuramoyl-tripeptide--D-alanyl-D-alanine ligase [Aerosakkonema funiforme FACHB-1375]MBD3558203.1 UDP-N-acetylmuramoyl-tripeptide--D-alanyl-D-alanine ligase [Planktothrix sp. FACHB-1355]
MMPRATIAQLSEILALSPKNLSEKALATLATGISTDTRSLMPGEVFLALRGENFDGHKFVRSAVEKGAIAIITERDVDDKLPADFPELRVADTLKAYQAIASWWRDRFPIPVIAVTGSFGKTTTKELIAAVLSTKGRVLKTQANYNNEIGVPKTLLELGPEHDFAVIEMAMRGRGQIAELTQIAHPTIGVITNVGTAHIGILGTEEAIAQAKCELLAEISPTAVAILNQDNCLLMETAATVWQGQTITYGLEGGDLRGELINLETLRVEGLEFPLPLPGRHNAQNYLAALAVAKVLQIDRTPLTAGLSVTLPEGRAKRYELPNDIVILDETYNAGLESMLAALNLLAQTPGQRHIAVLGTMKELGEKSSQLHRQVGAKARELNLDALLILADDPQAEAIAQGAEPLPSECFKTHADVVKRLKEVVREGDRILFKASHSVGLDRVVNEFRQLEIGH